MAAGVIFQTVTTTTGETVELGFYVDDTVTPTTWIPVRVNTNAAGAVVAFGSGANGATVQRFSLATDSPGVTAAAPAFAKITDGTDTALVDSNGSLQVFLKDANGASITYDIGVKPMNFAVAATTLQRPNNTTQYSVNDSVSNNGTAGSVTALSATVSDTNDAPINLTHITLDTNDTGIGAATVSMRVYVYNSDPTASSGVGGGDNAAFSNRKAGLVGTFVGTFVAMSDGGKCNCIPESGVPYLVTKPTSGAKTLFVQHQIIGGTPTPSANSTTIDTTLCGFQGRAT